MRENHSKCHETTWFKHDHVLHHTYILVGALISRSFPIRHVMHVDSVLPWRNSLAAPPLRIYVEGSGTVDCEDLAY